MTTDYKQQRQKKATTAGEVTTTTATTSSCVYWAGRQEAHLHVTRERTKDKRHCLGARGSPPGTQIKVRV